jgi:hypothetical protein
MKRKEWREVGRHSLFFVLALACVPLLLAGLADLLQGKPFDGEKAAIMAGLWLLVFSMFMGLSPFAMDAKQKAMEYLLTLPLSRRRLLWIKFLPRLAAVVFFYLVYSFFYAHYGHAAFGSGFPFFSLCYFSLFLISFSLAVIDENFIVQSICAGIALCGHLAACLLILARGFAWKFGMPASWTGTGVWQNLALDPPTLAVSAIVFLLLALPFVLSLFLAFDRFDLKPARAFNRRQLRVFVMLLAPAIALSLGVTYLVQGRSSPWRPEIALLHDQSTLRIDADGTLALAGVAGRRTIDTGIRPLWARLLVEKEGRLFLGGYAIRDGYWFLGRLDLAAPSWRILHRCRGSEFIAPDVFGFVHDGEGFVYLKRGPKAPGRPDREDASPGGTMALELVCLDMEGAVRSTVPFPGVFPRRDDQPRFVGHDRMGGKRFWLIANPERRILRLWEDARVEDLGPAAGALPVYTRGLLIGRGEGGLVVRRLLEAGAEDVSEIPGRFSLHFAYRTQAPGIPLDELYATSGGRIVGIDTQTLAVRDVGPERGRIALAAGGDFYYIESETWPRERTRDAWKKLYRLRNGRMVLLRKFEFGDAGYGHLRLDHNWIVLTQFKEVKGETLFSSRYFSLPGLKEVESVRFD